MTPPYEIAMLIKKPDKSIITFILVTSFWTIKFKFLESLIVCVSSDIICMINKILSISCLLNVYTMKKIENLHVCQSIFPPSKYRPIFYKFGLERSFKYLWLMFENIQIFDLLQVFLNFVSNSRSNVRQVLLSSTGFSKRKV